MKKEVFALIILLSAYSYAQTIWNGPTMTFTKPNHADFTLEQYQDRITSNVWITRGNSKGIFNIKQEVSYTGSGTSGNSPVDTEWAFGTTDNLGSLTFTTWAIAMDQSPMSQINKDMVVHLISDNIYIDIKFLSWSNFSSGAGFSYQRSTDSQLSTEEFSMASFKILPNPSNSFIKITLPQSINEASIYIYNIYGKNILKKNITKVNSSINIAFLSNGLYIASLNYNNQTFINRFIKI
ncbi:T9SS type A sorting domain-containing protein [Aestuariivivens insulae]|uniref:T9SS type A sorting domain-containing protein n=1 Tax=Aestuariivivens insulae TaxID=1621988 RepID=UPI001F5A1A0A|nr:T9SS type A sorting domain-containing protein [Aestuariivivens insulae]